MKTQKEKVLEIFATTGYINNFYCINTRLTIRLGAIMNELKNEGLVFETSYGKNLKEFYQDKDQHKNFYYYKPGVFTKILHGKDTV